MSKVKIRSCETLPFLDKLGKYLAVGTSGGTRTNKKLQLSSFAQSQKIGATSNSVPSGQKKKRKSQEEVNRNRQSVTSQ